MTKKIQKADGKKTAAHKDPSSGAVTPARRPIEAGAYVLTDDDREVIRLQINSLDTLQFKKTEGGLPVPDHPSEFVGEALIAKSLGITDLNLYRGVLLQLVEVTWDSKFDLGALNFALGLVRSIEPKDQLETILALQMAAVHLASMKFAGKMNRAKTLEELEVYERIVNKLMRTSTSQMEALRKHRNGGSQKVFVKHVHVHEGGQAIVGSVSREGR